MFFGVFSCVIGDFGVILGFLGFLVFLDDFAGFPGVGCGAVWVLRVEVFALRVCGGRFGFW